MKEDLLAAVMCAGAPTYTLTSLLGLTFSAQSSHAAQLKACREK